MESNKIKRQPNPRDQANIFSVIVWWWIRDLFKKGYSKVLTFQDLYEPLKNDHSVVLGNKIEKQWNIELKRARKMNDQPNLFKVVFVTFRKEIFILGVIHFFLDLIFKLGLPLLLGLLLKYFKPQTTLMFEEAMIYTAVFIITNVLTVVSENQSFYQASHIAGRTRIALCSLVYRKALKVNSTVLGETSSGRMLNILANDVNRFELVFTFLHIMWTTPISTLIIMYILYREIHLAGLIGISVLFIVLPIQVYVANLSTKYRAKSVIRTDERIRLMDEIIFGVQVIKMYAWEKPFSDLIESSRGLELNVLRKIAYTRGFFLTIFISVTRVALYFTIMAMLFLDEELTIDKIFIFTSFYNTMASTITGKFVRGFTEIAESKISSDRIQNFLMLKEFQPSNVIKFEKPMSINSSEANNKNESVSDAEQENKTEEREICVKVNNLTAKWNVDLLENVLENLNVELEREKLYAVIGTVGSGKSSFLSAILGEIQIVEGNVKLAGIISYASQNAWIFGATIRQNILFGQKFDKGRYQNVIDVCSLVKDFQQFPDADLTLLDEKGSSLSGGQKARINLARTIYKDADIYLLDDPLSAVDANIGKRLFEKCILQYLKGKTRILVTHQLQNVVKNVDGIMLFDQGKMQFYKDYQMLLEEHTEYNDIIISDNVQNSTEVNYIEQTELRNRMTSIKNNFNLSDCKDKVAGDNRKQHFSDNIEQSSKGVVKGIMFFNYFQSGSSLCSIFKMIVLFLLTQVLLCINDFYVPILVTVEEYRNSFNKLNNHSNYFINSTASDFSKENYSRKTYTLCYTMIVISIFVVGILRTCIFFNLCIRNSRNLHKFAFDAILRARMHFFDKNPSGRILNRFTKDMAAIDEQLPKTLLDAIQMTLNFIGSFGLVFIIKPIFVMPGFIIGYLNYWIFKIYLKSGKNLKRLEGMTRSPIFTHLNITLNGITTIRAFNAQTNFNEEFDRVQDNHTSSWYLYNACSYAYSFMLDLCTIIFILFVTLTFVLFKEEFSSSQVGLAITQILSTTIIIQWGMRQSAETSNLMMYVERILEYKQIPPEKNIFSQKRQPKIKNKENEQNLLTPLTEIPEDWLSSGAITFKNVFITYEAEKKPVLKDLNFQIYAMEKIGIVGRTGAGKSTLLNAIFRTVDINGIIEIDGIDTATISLKELRSRISIIPQDPVLFSGTIRYNLDPFDQFPDNDLWTALEEVEMKDVIITAENGLNYQVLDRGSNFSIGQRQLICLARSILRNNRILVVDEATASVDPHTDYLIQKTIKRKFASCTILTIAHRLHTVIESDRIMVMDNGRLVEFEHPYKLLKKEESHFNFLVKKTGEEIYEQFLKLAEQCYNEKYSDSV